MSRLSLAPYALALCTPMLLAADLPDGPGRAELDQLCAKCHEIERSVSKKQDRAGWQATITKMQAMGTKGTDAQFAAVLEYLVKNYPADEIPLLDINKATAIQMESRLALKRSQAAAIIAWRKEHGKIASFDDLKQIPGLDIAHLEERKDRIKF
ncbi:MAG: helix-hairpin-helix domain-containing protein [Bryobacteraceae bacterium]